MALIDLVHTGVAAEPGDGRARVEVTLIHHADHNGTCEHECGCTGPTAADAECDEGDEGDEGDDEGRSGEGSCDAAPTGGSRGGTGTPNAPATRSGTDTRHGEAAGPDNRTAELPDNSTVDRAHGPDDTGTRERTRTENGDRTDRTDRPGPAPGRGRDPSARSGWPGLTDLEGHPIRGEQAGVWSCAAERSVLTADRNGVPLHLGRSRRLASPAQRKALAIRDGGCTFPGCEHPAMWTDAHHVTAWEHGGRTDLDQLVSLCRRHHGIAHRAGWVLTLGDDGWTRWTTPSGVTITGQRHHRRPDDAAVRSDVDAGSVIGFGSGTGTGIDRGKARDGTRVRRDGRGPGARAPDRPAAGRQPRDHEADDGWADTG